mgnify:CR=1 FL=1
MEARCTFAASPFSRTLPACRSLGEIASVFACKQKMMDAGGNDASPWSVLPPELMEMVWLFLPFPEMCFVNEVCRSWRNAISPNNERFWSLVHQSYVNPVPHLVSNGLLQRVRRAKRSKVNFLV